MFMNSSTSYVNECDTFLAKWIKGLRYTIFVLRLGNTFSVEWIRQLGQSIVFLRLSISVSDVVFKRLSNSFSPVDQTAKTVSCS